MDRRQIRALEIQELREAIARGNPKGITAVLFDRVQDDELGRMTLRSLSLDKDRRDLLLEFAKCGNRYVVGKVFNDLLGHVIKLRDAADKVDNRVMDKSREAAIMHTEAARLEGFCRLFAEAHDAAHRPAEVPESSKIEIVAPPPAVIEDAA